MKAKSLVSIISLLFGLTLFFNLFSCGGKKRIPVTLPIEGNVISQDEFGGGGGKGIPAAPPLYSGPSVIAPIRLPGDTNTWFSVHFLDADTGYVVGAKGRILKTTDGGASWTTQYLSYEGDIRSVHFPVDATTGYIVGGQGRIFKTTDGGASWSEKNSGVSPAYWLNSVHFPVGQATTGYIVGGGGTILKTTDGGTTWVKQNSNTIKTLYSVHFPVDDKVGYAVGDEGVILKTTDGEKWEHQTSGTTMELSSVYFLNAMTGYAVGGNIILKTTDGGATWTKKVMGVTGFSGVHFPPEQTTTGYISRGYMEAGTWKGEILITTDGGENWFPQPVPDRTYPLYSVHFPTANIGYAVGSTGTLIKIGSFSN